MLLDFADDLLELHCEAFVRILQFSKLSDECVFAYTSKHFEITSILADPTPRAVGMSRLVIYPADTEISSPAIRRECPKFI